MGVKGSMGKCKVQRRVEKRGTQRRIGMEAMMQREKEGRISEGWVGGRRWCRYRSAVEQPWW